MLGFAFWNLFIDPVRTRLSRNWSEWTTFGEVRPQVGLMERNYTRTPDIERSGSVGGGKERERENENNSLGSAGIIEILDAIITVLLFFFCYICVSRIYR